MIRMTLPGLTEFPDLNLMFATLREKQPDMFFEDVVIDSIYGGFPNSKLCGGRNTLGEEMPLESIASVVQRYNSIGVGCNATFSNMCLTQEDIDNALYERGILNILAQGEGNGVIVHSHELAQFVRREFPQLTLISSTTKQLPSIAATNKEAEFYDRVVLNYNFTHDEEAIAQVEQPGKLEVMANEYCTLNCPYRTAHYKDVSQCQKAGRKSQYLCRHEPSPQAYGFLQGLIEGDVFLKNADIRRYNQKFGIESFKIAGRGLERYDVIDAYLYYLVQPDCWYELRDFIVAHDFL